jgi:hypothetical protein
MRPTNATCGDDCDYPLSELLLGSRTSVYPSLQELRVVPYQVDGYRQVRCEIDGHERPCLPVIERSRWDEQQRRHDEKQEQHPAECLYNQDPHFAPLLKQVGKASAKSRIAASRHPAVSITSVDFFDGAILTCLLPKNSRVGAKVGVCPDCPPKLDCGASHSVGWHF